MKHFYLALALITFSFNLLAQEGELPSSFFHTELLSDVDPVLLPSLDLDRIAQEDMAEELETGKTWMGRVIPTEHDLLEEGTWTDLPN